MSAGVTMNGSLATHAVSPAGMAAVEVDYAGATGSFARLTPNAAGSAISGIAGGVDGRVLTIVNLGNTNITILHQDAASAAQNRIITKTGAPVVMLVDGVLTFVYDAVTSRWRQSTTL